MISLKKEKIAAILKFFKELKLLLLMQVPKIDELG
jgi:hypothetical protein